MPRQRRPPARVPATKLIHSATASHATAPVRLRDGVLVPGSYGVGVAVGRGRLVASHGIGDERRPAMLSRASCGPRRLVVLGHAGTVSREALRWLHGVGAAFVPVDADGQVIAATAPVGLDDPRLRRAQALAATNGAGLAIARGLLREKLRGQADVLGRLPGATEAQAGATDGDNQVNVTH